MKKHDDKLFELSVDNLLSKACKKVKLSDWGEDDGFKTALQVLIDSFENDDKSNGMRRLYFRNECTRLLCNRLNVQNDLKKHPDILNVSIKRPLFIIGSSRTGTTLLHNLLSQDQNSRCIKYWEMLRPSPPPDIYTRETDERIEIAKKQVTNLYQNLPELRRIHEIKADGPEECNFLMRHTFMTMSFYSDYKVFSYVKWIYSQDKTEAYKYYRKLLQIMLWRCPGEHLVLKDTSRLADIDTLLKVFPDANIVWTHRDPLEMIPSTFSLRKNAFNDLDFDEVAESTRYFAHNIEIAMKSREKANEKQFFDVSYNKLVSNPANVVKDICKYFNYDFDTQMESRINDWLKENKQHKYGVHKYGIDEFGLSEGYIKELFHDYYKKYNAVLT